MNKKIRKGWINEIGTFHSALPNLIAIDEDSNYFKCLKCLENNNSYGIFLKTNLIQHFLTLRHCQSLNNKSLNDEIVEALKRRKYEEEMSLESHIIAQESRG